MKIKTTLSKSFFALLLSLGVFLNIGTAEASLLTEASENPSGPTGMIGELINAFGDLQALGSQLTEEEANLNFERTFEFPSLVQLEKNQNSIDKKNEEILAIEQKVQQLDETIADTKDILTAILQEQIDFADNPPLEMSDEDIEKKISEFDNKVEEYQSLLEEYDATQVEYDAEIKLLELEIEDLIARQPDLETALAERQKIQIENIAQYEKNIDQVLEQIARQKRLIESQLVRAGISLAVFAGAILLLLVIRFIVSKIIKRFYINITERRKKALLRLSRISFNVIIAIVVLTILFSQFASLLPFLILLGTGFAFAVRDSISSFIGWFVIGTDRGFKLNDIIMMGDAYGQVKEISSLNTVLWEMEDGVRTGKLITFPNKRIFDKSLVNYSRAFKINRIHVAFWLSPKSDIEAVQNILMPLLEDIHVQFEKEISRARGLSDEEKIPRIAFESHEKHIKVTGEVLVPSEEKASIKRDLTEKFLIAAQKSKKVDLGE